MMRLQHLRAFDAVAATGGFGAAARLLGVTQPAISAQVAALEKQHGVRLIDRRTGLPTDVGEGLREITRPLFALAAEAERVLVEAGARVTGTVRVAVDAPGYAMPLLAAVRRALPGLRIHLTAGNAGEVLERVRIGDAGVGFAADAPADTGLRRIPLHVQDLVAVVHTDHPRAGERTVILADLLTEPLIGREPGSVTRAALEESASAMGVTPQYDMIAGSREAVLAAVASGLGVGIVAEDEMLDDPRLVMLDIREPVISVTEYLICRTGTEVSPVWRALVAALPQ